jgi:hypothetical protein
MKPETEFLDALRSVTVHLIKHDSPLHKPLVGIVELYDKHTWFDLPVEEKLAHLQAVEDYIPTLEEYYKEYPHGWSRDRYEDMKSGLNPCREAIKGAE